MSEVMDEKLDKEPLFEDKYCGVYFKKLYTGLPLNQICIEHCFILTSELSFIRSYLPDKYAREFIKIMAIVNLKTQTLYKSLRFEDGKDYLSRVAKEIKKENSMLEFAENTTDMDKHDRVLVSLI